VKSRDDTQNRPGRKEEKEWMGVATGREGEKEEEKEK
jgi:hypothetical protein